MAARGCSQLPPPRARARVALKIHHEVMDKPPLPCSGGQGGTRRSTAGHPCCPSAGGTAPCRPASRTGARGYVDSWRRARKTAGAGWHTACPWPPGQGWAPTPGLAAPRDITWPGPGSCAGRARGNERGEGPGPHRPPTRERPQAAITLWGFPGQPRRERGRAGLCAGAGTAAFLPPPRRGVAGVPPWPRATGHLLRLPPGPARGAAGIKPTALPPLSSPRPPRATPRGGAACAPVGQTATEPKTRRKRKGNKGREKTTNHSTMKKKIKVTKGKNTNSLVEYKDLESDGATTASLERGGHGHTPPASSTTRFGARGAQRAGVRPSPCPSGEEEGWPGARTAQCSPHPRRGFGEGG